MYTKWLDKNGFNKMTALRYKRRYRLFEQLETVVGKNILMTLPQKMIDELSLKPEEDIKKYLKLLDEGKNKQELQMIMENKIEVVQIASMVDFDFSKEYEKINDKLKKISFDNLSSDGSSFTVPIYSNNKDFFNITFNCTAKNNPGNLLNHTNNTIILTDGGEVMLRIAATAQPRLNQTPGRYTGQITMRATYE